MKIYFIGQKGIPAISGGVERHVEELATRLVKEGHEVFVYCRNYFTPKGLTEYKGVKLIHLPSIKTKHLDAISHTLLASLDVLRRDADIIHYHAIGPSSLLWIPKLFKRSAKVISTFHSDDRKHKKWGVWARKFLGLGAYISVKWSDKCIAVSQYQSQVHSQEFNGELDYIPNGVNQPAAIKPQIITAKWGLVGNDYILAVSRLIRHKGLHYLIRAYSILKNTDKKLVIVGDANFTEDYVQYLKSLAGDNPNIIFTGNQTGTALAELYSNAYLFVQPSEAEGLSIALLEAMSYGKGVLVSDIAPNREAVSEIGLTFISKSITDLSQKLQYLLNHPEVVQEMGEKLQYRSEIEYNWENIVKKTIDAYNSVLSSKNQKTVTQMEIKSA
ncbi:MAG: glycosyltransferase family 4 protein [Candidatus Parcubacteria bacterium]|nr:glycosyltransferase family 4 protein [Candidatus Parcubacteria bacterium]